MAPKLIIGGGLESRTSIGLDPGQSIGWDVSTALHVSEVRRKLCYETQVACLCLSEQVCMAYTSGLWFIREYVEGTALKEILEVFHR